MLGAREGEAVAFRGGDARAVREAAHSLLGVIATVSSSAGDAASTVEDAAADRDLARASAAFEQLKAVAGSVLAGIDKVTWSDWGRSPIDPDRGLNV